jgi:predicted O-linked N-acetylglucosamine transferase (SPINDLY family)
MNSVVTNKFAAAVQYHRAGNLAAAEHLLRQICADDPKHAGSLHLLGIVAHQLGRPDAIGFMRRLAALKPSVPEVHNDLGVMLGSQAKFADAIGCFEQAISLKRDYAEAHNNLGQTFARLGRFTEAFRCFEQTLAINPNLAMAHLYLGNVLLSQGKPDEARIHYERALKINPTFAMAHYNLATILEAQGRNQEAIDHLQRTLALQPNFAEAHSNLGGNFRHMGMLGEALAHCQRAAELKPNFAGAHNNLGNVLKELGRLDEAVLQYEKALALQPNFAPAHYNLGVALRGQSMFVEAAECFERALVLKPEFIEARFALCMAQLPILYVNERQIAERRAEYEKHLKLLSDEIEKIPPNIDLVDIIGAHQPFYLAYQGHNDRDLQALYGSIVCRIMARKYAPVTMPAPPASDEPVKIGIVSGFFRHHSNWKIPIEGWLSQLDRQRFRLFGYYTEGEQDSDTRTAAEFCERFVQGPLSLDSWRNLILNDAPHVLIYPEIGMDRVSAQLAAQRLAPVQCTSWGHPETSGFPTLDYYLSSELMEPEHAQDHYTEHLVRLPNLSVFCQPVDTKPAVLDRVQFGLRTMATVYWCSQALYKYLPQYDQIFARIAREVADCQFTFIAFPGSQLVTKIFHSRLNKSFADCGMNAVDHCVFMPRLDPAQYIGAIGLCDVVLDSIGWSGCNSMIESLIHDRPIVTMRGSLMRGRHTAAILTMMGETETVTDTVDEYISMAVRLGKDASLRARFRAKIAENKHRVYGDRACIVALESFLDSAPREAYTRN